MRVSDDYINFLKDYETLSLEAYIGPEGGSTYTIGYGSYDRPGVTGDTVITQEQAETWLREDISVREDFVNQHVTVRLTQSQFDALVDYRYNTGAPPEDSAFQAINAGTFYDAMIEMAGRRRAGGEISRGVIARRNDEIEMFMGASYKRNSKYKDFYEDQDQMQGFITAAIQIGLRNGTLTPHLAAVLLQQAKLYGDSALVGAIETAMFESRIQCFLAGTPVTMADGSTKPIEQVRPDDWVMSFDSKTGDTKPGRVKRTMQNTAKIVLDFHDTFVTPGHVYWCAGGTFEGKFAALIDILRDDGVIQHQDGTLIRAATGCAVGSPDDETFWAFLTREDPDGTDRVTDKRQLRFGTRWMLPDGRHFTMRDYMAGIGVESQPDGYMRWTREGIVAPLVWVLSERLPDPEDYVLARSRTTLADIYRAGVWEGARPAMPAPMVRDGGPVQALSATRLAAMTRNRPVVMEGGAASAGLLPERTKNRHQRKAEEARMRQDRKSGLRVH